MTWRTRWPLVAATLVWLGFLAAFDKPLAERRPAPLELRAGVEILVTSPNDAGPGSLREAIFAADRAGARARIEIRTAHIALESSLPPLVNPNGVVIDASHVSTEIDARAVPSGPVLDLAAARSVVRGLRIRGAAGPGILVRTSGARLTEVTLVDCDVGVHLVEGAEDLLVESSTFEANGTGVRVAAGASGVSVYNNRFRKQERAAVWAVSPSAPGTASPIVVVRQNRFDEDRISVLLINVPGQVEENQFMRAGEAAIYLTGPGVVRRNHLQGGGRTGLFADAPDGALIEDNELDHNFAVGILLRRARRTEVLRNRVYENGYGIVVVFGDSRSPAVVADNLVLSQREDGLYVVAASPVLRGNRALANRRAGLRVLDYVPAQGVPVAGNPLLQDNVLRDNGLDAPVRGEYREPRLRQEAS